ncbi:MAG: hypothetical protein JWP71_2830 [Mucilaginibacter sp.]|nr:hypothetical protein [Mucilaginibacter sp.]
MTALVAQFNAMMIYSFPGYSIGLIGRITGNNF